MPPATLRGRYLSWLAWYGDVVEPVLVHTVAGLSHPALRSTFRGMEEMVARYAAALDGADWLVGGHYTAADLLLASPFSWMPALTPEAPAIKAWIARCQARPSVAFAQEYDAKLLA
ncbi:MAG: glutathione binding-like protein [Paracoccaceae bacterium]